jgi:hypothetical protein
VRVRHDAHPRPDPHQGWHRDPAEGYVGTDVFEMSEDTWFWIVIAVLGTIVIVSDIWASAWSKRKHDK